MTEILLGSVTLIVLVLVLAGLVMALRAVILPSRPAIVTVNTGTQLRSSTGQKLLTVLNDAGLRIPSGCAGVGTCGLCRVKIADGAGEPRPTETARLSKSELKDGMHLACQVVLRRDLSVVVPDELLDAEEFTCTVIGMRPLTPLIREVTLQLPDGARPEIMAGAFMEVTAPPYSLDYADLDVPDAHAEVWSSLRDLHVTSTTSVTRAYSIANRPEDSAAGRIVLNIRLALPPPAVADAQPGIVSSWLFSLRDGMQITATGPFGTFRAQGHTREMVFIGGGVGMAPLRAMIFEQLERLGSDRPISFWYGARSRVELFYEDQFAALADKHSNFSWTVALSDPPPEDHWDGATGFIHSVAYERYLRDHPAPEDCQYYLCGPPLMIRAVKQMLDDLGVEPDSIFHDDFGV